jgi:peptide/nickel transport system substrate-binding protein
LAKAENVVRWAVTADATTFEPWAHDNTPTSAVQRQVYEMLVCRDYERKLEPCLLETEKRLDDHTWEFKLRQGVRFHDGTPLTAEDVVFSFERAKAETSTQKDWMGLIAKAEAIDPSTVRVTMRRPTVWPWGDVIVSETWMLAHDSGLPPTEDKLESAYTHTHADGTGPFRLESFEPGVRTVLVRNPDWWGLQRWPHNVDRIEQIKVKDPNDGLERLLKGEVDILSTPPLDRIAEITGKPGITVSRGSDTTQILYLSFDMEHSELRTASIKGKNPFQDRRVRQAVERAVDPEGLARALGGLAIPSGALPVWPRATGWSKELDARPPRDLSAAKALLAEAGYQDGFNVALDCPMNREPVCRAVQPMLAEAGIRIELRLHKVGEQDDLVRGHATDFYLWGYNAIDEANLFMEDRLDSKAAYNTGYADPELDRLIAGIDSESTTERRVAAMEQVWRKVLPEAVCVPLVRPLSVWVMRDRLELPIGADSAPQFRYARVKS